MGGLKFFIYLLVLLLDISSTFETDSIPSFGSPIDKTELWVNLVSLPISEECQKGFKKLIFNMTENFVKGRKGTI